MAEALVALIAVIGSIVGTGVTVAWVLGSRLGALTSSVEDMRGDIKVLFERGERMPCAAHAERLDGHEYRLQQLERRA